MKKRQYLVEVLPFAFSELFEREREPLRREGV